MMTPPVIFRCHKMIDAWSNTRLMDSQTTMSASKLLQHTSSQQRSFGAWQDCNDSLSHKLSNSVHLSPYQSVVLCYQYHNSPSLHVLMS
mmetsp:Transcript_22165/g.61699  ORF Transcript_22165/g.61699 Transcript_22165/m.61699 type:complete len:89 (+) Transcript_22165:412-678(+)